MISRTTFCVRAEPSPEREGWAGVVSAICYDNVHIMFYLHSDQQAKIIQHAGRGGATDQNTKGQHQH